MSIMFPDTGEYFGNDLEVRLNIMISSEMEKSLDQLGAVLGRDRSKTVRWCLEQMLKEAIAQGKIPDPRNSD